MGYSNVAGALNVFSSTSTQSLTVRGDTNLNGSLTAMSGFHNFGNVTTANLVVTGNFTVTATNTQVSNALSINNAGTSTALEVVQYEGGGPGHSWSVAEFWDYQTLAMVIDPEGNVGIHTTSSPGYALTVSQGALFDAVTSSLFIGNASGLSNLTTSNLNGLILAPQLSNTQTNITSVGILNSLNVNSVTNLVTVTALLYLGNASGLSNLNPSNLVGYVANANVAGVVTNPAQPNITSLGILNSLNVAPGVSNLVSLQSSAVNVATSLNVTGTSNLSGVTNVTTLNAASIFGTNLNVTGTSNLSGTNVTTLNVTGLANVYNANVTNTLFTTNIFAAGFTSNSTNIVTGKDRKSTRLNSSHLKLSRMPSSA